MSDAKNKWLLGAVSAAAIASATLWEGTRFTPYDDIAGVLTVCQGHTGADIVRDHRYSPAECRAYLTRELGAAGTGVLGCTNVAISQAEYDAYSLFAYNVGVTAFCGSTLHRHLNAGDHVGACDGLPAWSRAHVGGKLVVVQGLLNRRMAERKICMEGL